MVWCPKPGKAAWATQELHHQGYVTFNPQIADTIRVVNGQSQPVMRDLFPGYQFVTLGFPGQPWEPIKGTFGVRTLLLSTALRPLIVPTEDMAKLLATPILYTDWISCQDLAPGTRVEMVTELFSGLGVCGTVFRKASRRIEVLLNILGRPVKVWVAPTGVQLVGWRDHLETKDGPDLSNANWQRGRG